MLAAPLSNVSAYRVLRDNVGDSLRDVAVWARSAQPRPAAPACPPCAALCLAGRCACPHGRLATDGVSCMRKCRILRVRYIWQAYAHRPSVYLHVRTAYESFLMFSRVTEIDSIHLEERNLNSPYPPIRDKSV